MLLKDAKRTPSGLQSLCLANKDTGHVPSTVSEKEVLTAAGLGEQKVSVSNVECTTKEFHEVLIQKFPKLMNVGGFELLRCVANTRLLEPISTIVTKSPKILKRVIGNGRIYIRPIQKNLDLTPVDDQSTS